MCGELTLNQISDLQAWVSSVAVNPLDKLSQFKGLQSLPPEDRRFLLSKAWEEAESFPPKFGSDASNVLLSSPEGMAQTLYTMLRVHQPVTLEEARDVVRHMNLEEWVAVQRVATNRTPKEEIEAELDPKARGKAARPNGRK